MKKLLLSLMLAISALSLIADAVARPMGGGRSFGRQSSSVSRMRAPAPAPAPYQQPQRQYNQAPPVQPPYAPPQRPSMWKGVLGGALLGLGLGSLFSHMGIGAGMASGISTLLTLALLALVVMFIFRMFRRKDTPANPNFRGFNEPMPASATPEIGSGLGYQPNAYQPNAYQPNAYQPMQPAAGSVTLDKPHTPWGVPADFDTEAFLRQAKSSFIRMQAAWDKGDVQDLREFTTPEVFAELRMQIQERAANDFTDVVSIDAQLLGIETSDKDYLASVQFNGMMRTAQNAPAEPFAEVWNMTKPLSGSSGWLLAGIQQLS